MIKTKRHLFIFFAFLLLCETSAIAQSCNCLNIEDYGVVINGKKDNTLAFQKAIDEASATGSCLQMKAGIIRISGTLNLKAGVTLTGAGRGPTDLDQPSKGTVILYSGDSSALTVTGSNVSLNNFVVSDENSQAKYGLLFDANNLLIESASITNVLIYGFTNGTALKLFAENGGGICYSSFYDLRIRNAKTGIEMDRTDSASFVNSNSFFHGVISGENYDYGILINTGNNNVFYSTVIEPYNSVFGHLVVNNGQLTGENIRIEAARQPASKPVVNFNEGTSGSLLTGLYGGGLIINHGNNQIHLTSATAIGESNPGFNMFVNAEFLLPDTNNIPAFWQISKPGIIVNTTEETVVNGENVICLRVPPDVVCDFMPQQSFLPPLPTIHLTDLLTSVFWQKPIEADVLK